MGALGTGEAGAQQSASGDQREFYLLRRYRLNRAQAAACDGYLGQVLLPALHRLGYTGVGCFGLEYGPESPTTYLLLRHTDALALVQLDRALLQDAAFVKAAESFRGAAGVHPAFERVDSTLSQAFQGKPVLQLPAKGKHILQMRTYESPSELAHLRKIEMFHSGEFEIFAQCGMPGVFYAQNLIGERLPSLTYMLAFPSLAEMEAAWQRFRDNPAWKKLSTDPRFSYEDLVSNITNLVLTPKGFSEI